MTYMDCPGCESPHAKYSGTCGGEQLIRCHLCGYFGSKEHNIANLINPLTKTSQEIPEDVVDDSVAHLQTMIGGSGDVPTSR